MDKFEKIVIFIINNYIIELLLLSYFYVIIGITTKPGIELLIPDYVYISGYAITYVITVTTLKYIRSLTNKERTNEKV